MQAQDSTDPLTILLHMTFYASCFQAENLGRITSSSCCWKKLGKVLPLVMNTTKLPDKNPEAQRGYHYDSNSEKNPKVCVTSR